MRRNAVLFVVISLVSGFGSTAMTLSAGIWVFDLTGSPGIAALTGLCIYAPTLAAPWLGALVDRLPRRPLMIWTDLLLAAIMLTLLTVSAARDAWLIYAVLLARGVSYVLIDAGETAILPSALPPDRLGDVNGWRTSAQEGMKLVAPLAGAGLYAWTGPTPVVLLAAAMPLLTAACYALLRLNLPTTANATDVASTQESAPTRGRPGQVRDGLRALFGNPAVRVPVLVAAVAIGLSGLTNAGVIAQVTQGLHLPATRLGFLSTAQGAGSIVSGLVAGRLLARRGPAAIAALGALVFGAGCVASAMPWWPSMIAGSALAGIGLVWALIAGMTVVQTETPDHLLGRVGATSTTVMFGPVAVAIPLGAVAVQLGPAAPLLIAAALTAPIAVLTLAGARRHSAAVTAA
ncbi:MFS transporter [Paractinoplanes toevensis]|uniref:MFS transporter n=1 Tax=Paractinoplanes toevensis TaxID=571911 RepID=A0A919TFQ6_9ACTN|nr:MFS transporter [Actinoplanes toevensis]GIM94522.1 MFS transporter [Actinoplanes toevensis]